MVAQTNTPSTAERILGGDSQEAAPAARQPFEPEMVLIPEGSFTMGSPASEPQRRSNEGPQRMVKVAAFELGKTEVTFAQWDACVADGDCSYRPEDDGIGRGQRPVVNVSWEDIQIQFIPWINRKTGKRYRLPSEAEWEYAARAGCSSPFNIGGQCVESISANQARFFNKADLEKNEKSVGSYPANSWNLYDMHGNAWEWVGDCYDESYTEAASDSRARLTGDCKLRVLRSGSWGESQWVLRSASRDASTADSRNYAGGGFGFRLARAIR